MVRTPGADRPALSPSANLISIPLRLPITCSGPGKIASVGAPLRIDGGSGLSLTIRSGQTGSGSGGGDCPPAAC
jgi:hypothetical protein